MTYPLVQLRRFARMYYGDALSSDERVEGNVPVMGSNGPFASHDAANLGGPCIIVGRKGSHGKVTWCSTSAWVTDTAFGIDNQHTDADLRWLYYALQTARLDQTSLDTGVPGLAREFAYGQRIPLAPALQQRAIAVFLDAATARIDALIAKKQRLATVLEDRWVATVQSETRVGQETRVKFLTSLITSGPRGWADRVGDTGEPFIRSGNLTEKGIEISGEVARVEAARGGESARSRVVAGDVVVGITGANTSWVGLVDDTHAGGYVSQHVGLLRPAGVEPRWLAFCLMAPAARQQLLGEQYGGTKQQLGLWELAELRIGVPERSEQRRRVRVLERQYERHRSLSDGLNRQVSLLREHRRALITAAVTGELEVPGVAP